MTTRRTVAAILLSAGCGVFAALFATASVHFFPFAWLVATVVGLFVGVVLSPLLMLAAHKRPLFGTFVAVVVATLAAAFLANAMVPAVAPCIGITTWVTACVLMRLAPRGTPGPDPTRCANCGYARQGWNQVCPECGCTWEA